MSVELVILTGLQAAGKTTFYRERFAATHVHISKDAWPNARKKEARQRRLATRRRSFDGLNPSRYSSRIHRTSLVKTSAAGYSVEHLRAGRSVVVDNTNPTAAARLPLIAIARAAGARVASYAFVASVEEVLPRNARREGRARIADAGIFTVAKQLAPPAPEEGFDARFAVRLTDQGFVVDELA